MIAPGFTCEAGCTPDGACWPAFQTTRPAIVRELDEGHRWLRGTLRFNRLLDAWEIFIIPTADPRWRRELVVCHELGHVECVTEHSDGKVWCHE